MPTTTISVAASLIAAGTGAADSHPSSPLQRFGLSIVLFFPLLAVLVVGLRVYSRLQTKQFGLDDGIIILAAVLSVAQTAASYMFIKTNYVGIHADHVPVDYDERSALIWNFVVQVLYNPILALVKTSVLLFLLKLGSQKQAVRLSIYVLNTFNLSLMVAIFVVVIFQCRPISFNWDVSEHGHCIKQGAFYMVTAALTILTDILSLALPFWVFLDLKLPRRVKVALLFVFLLGGLVTVVSIVCLVFLYRAFFQAPSSDPTYSIGFCVSIIETNLAIICASAPSLRGLLRVWFPHFFSSNRANYDYDYRYPTGASRGQHQRQHGGRASHIYGSGSVSTKITSRWKDSKGSKPGGGGRSGGRSADRRAKNGTNVDDDNSYPLRNLPGTEVRTHTEVQSHSISSSEEEIMTYNGIVRTMNVSVQYDNEEHNANREHSQRSRPGSSLGERRSFSGGV
ncbi:hypothetical protein CMQ_1403 [Grosmannia clavigera kw1407]|uniref:Rhodopsin domain-containing protein n=1 Tax=Grosmannia clavigera (strain kw1407 / UAMH 11150) TaxID=655863 RepID=F0XC38_GROCL|nr:uncharacterized protein CMQ_1403 [Grosmannia clavigera kw1407]EFX04475.1 hypothetical protein CMQ_1403 [Grosmannia clavigera kw1407]